ncbi:MAG: hypothetical protein ABEK59_06295 [Halobacteria archaeon]
MGVGEAFSEIVLGVIAIFVMIVLAIISFYITVFVISAGADLAGYSNLDGNQVILAASILSAAALIGGGLAPSGNFPSKKP